MCGLWQAAVVEESNSLGRTIHTQAITHAVLTVLVVPFSLTVISCRRSQAPETKKLGWPKTQMAKSRCSARM